MSVTLALVGFFMASPKVLEVAGIWAYINFLNLLPTLPLDGGNMRFAILSKEKGYFRRFNFEFVSWLAIIILFALTQSILILGLIIIFAFKQGTVLDKIESSGHFFEGDENSMNGKRLLASLLFFTLTTGLLLTYIFSFDYSYHLLKLKELKVGP